MEDIIKLLLEIINKILTIFDNIEIFNKQKYLYIKEENIRIDCTNFLTQITKRNRSIIPHKILINYYIDDNNCLSDKILEGKCNSESYSTYEFSIASTIIKKYDDTYCVGYDLNCNPAIEIRPILISPDGFSKRLSLQLNKSLHKNETIKIRIKYKTYGIMSGDIRYLVSSFNYRKIELDEYNISFHFNKRTPDNIRVYLIDTINNKYRFLYKLFPESENIFIDKCNTSKINKCEKRIYVF